MSSLASLLPTPIHHSPSIPESSSAPLPIQKSSDLAVTAPSKPSIPQYGQRSNWKPTSQADFGDGGAYPECKGAQYPLNLGRKNQSSAGTMLSLSVDTEGNVDYSAIARQGHRSDRLVQTSFTDLVPLAQRPDVKNSAMERPSEEDIASTTEKTRLALEKLVNTKIKAAQPKNVPNTGTTTTYMRYTPSSGPAGASGSQRIIQLSTVAEDPLEPPRFKHKKIPRGPPSPPAPVLRDPPRKVTAQEQKDWMIPPCVSNWKNNKGFTVPLDKRLAADGRGLQELHINDKFAQFSEALYIADRHAREEVRQRAQMQQRIAQKEKEAKEESLRLLAQRAREDRVGGPVKIASAGGKASALVGYGSDDESEAGDEGGKTPKGRAQDSDDEKSESGNEDNEEDEKAARERDELRRERRKDRERELRMNNMGTETRARVLARAQNRDISEKIALGLAKPTTSSTSMLDSRLFNQESYSASFGDDDSYNMYDRALFSGSNAATAIYKPRGNTGDDDGVIGGSAEGFEKEMGKDRWGLGVGVAGKGRGFEGADEREVKEGPVQFEVADPFGVDAFLEDARKGIKRGNPEGDKGEGSSKRARLDDD